MEVVVVVSMIDIITINVWMVNGIHIEIKYNTQYNHV